MSLAIIILAAGDGKRMRSDLPKVLQPVGGKPMLWHVVRQAKKLAPDSISVVYGHGGDAVRQRFAGADLSWCLQTERLGTGHAVAQALPDIDAGATVLVLYGDVPLITQATLQRMLPALENHAITLLSVQLANPRGYGRIIRDDNDQVRRIVEEHDANPAQRAVREVNTGILAAHARDLQRWLPQIGQDNAQGEYYLTDCIRLAVESGAHVRAEECADADEVMGVNDKSQLAIVERAYQRRLAADLMHQGVTVLDPARMDIRGHVTAGCDVTVDINVIFEGDVKLGEGVRVGANCVIRDTAIGAGTTILPNSVIEEAHIGADCSVGPFARIRPHTSLADKARVGNFVEIKASEIGAGSKINHLSYIGDTAIGVDTNVGAGTIVCNYDGVHKHRTRIGNDVFIGSDTQLVAPVSVGDGATIGAGSTITKDAPAGALTLSRSRQTVVKGWQRPKKAGTP